MIGDLEEEYYTHILPREGLRGARRWYWFQALRTVGQQFGRNLLKLSLLGGVAKALGWRWNRFGS